MSGVRTVITLRHKRDEILASIKLHERQPEQANFDQARVLAAIRIFEARGDPKDLGRYMDVHRPFKRGATCAISQAGLEARGPLTIRELTAGSMKSKGLGIRRPSNRSVTREGDAVL